MALMALFCKAKNLSIKSSVLNESGLFGQTHREVMLDCSQTVLIVARSRSQMFKINLKKLNNFKSFCKDFSAN